MMALVYFQPRASRSTAISGDLFIVLQHGDDVLNPATSHQTP
jgi:hypothetical protein